MSAGFQPAKAVIDRGGRRSSSSLPVHSRSTVSLPTRSKSTIPASSVVR